MHVGAPNPFRSPCRLVLMAIVLSLALMTGGGLYFQDLP